MGRSENQSAVLPDVRQVEVPHVDGNSGVTTWARGNLGHLGRERERKHKGKERKARRRRAKATISNI